MQQCCTFEVGFVKWKIPATTLSTPPACAFPIIMQTQRLHQVVCFHGHHG